MKRINVKIKGVAPLLQHRFPIEDHGINASKQKTKKYVPEDEAKRSLYQNDDIGIYQPAEHIYQALVKASTHFKFEGKKTYKDIIKAGITIEPECIKLISNGYIIDTRPVVIQRARVLCWRPRFEEWELDFDILILDEGNIEQNVVREILDRAGFEGIGSYRPRFGRFKVIEWKEL